jgi:hypothetical protein
MVLQHVFQFQFTKIHQKIVFKRLSDFWKILKTWMEVPKDTEDDDDKPRNEIKENEPKIEDCENFCDFFGGVEWRLRKTEIKLIENRRKPACLHKTLFLTGMKSAENPS